MQQFSTLSTFLAGFAFSAVAAFSLAMPEATTTLLSSALWNGIGYLMATWAFKAFEAEQQVLQRMEKIQAEIVVQEVAKPVAQAASQAAFRAASLTQGLAVNIAAKAAAYIAIQGVPKSVVDRAAQAAAVAAAEAAAQGIKKEAMKQAVNQAAEAAAQEAVPHVLLQGNEEGKRIIQIITSQEVLTAAVKEGAKVAAQAIALGATQEEAQAKSQAAAQTAAQQAVPTGLEITKPGIATFCVFFVVGLSILTVGIIYFLLAINYAAVIQNENMLNESVNPQLVIIPAVFFGASLFMLLLGNAYSFTNHGTGLLGAKLSTFY